MPFTTAGELIAAKRQPPVSVEPGATARAALRATEEEDIAFLLVIEGDKLVGGNRIDVLPEVVKAIDLHQRARLLPAQARAHHERRDS